MDNKKDIKMNQKDGINLNLGNKNINNNCEDKKSEDNPTSFQLILKVNLKSLLPCSYSYDEYLKKIHILSNDNIGFLFNTRLIIISFKSFQKIKDINPFFDELNSSKNNITGNEFVDFIELNNFDIAIWTSNVILIYNKDYNLFQKIDEYAQGNKSQREDYDYDTVEYYEINSIHELKNGKLVSCNSYGLKFYEKDSDGKYNLISTEKMEVDVNSLIEIKPNLLILLHKHFDETFGDGEGEIKYLISIYNHESKSLDKIFETTRTNTHVEPRLINYITNNKYLYMCYSYTMDIFDLEKNLENIDIKNDVYEYDDDYVLGLRRKMKRNKRITEVFANFSDTLFFGRDDKGNLKLYSFINNNLNVYCEFEYKNIIEVIILNKNEFILCSYKGEIYKFKPIFSKNKNK